MNTDETKLRGPASNAEASATFSARPRVELSRSSKGMRAWRISVVAEDETAEGLRAARDLLLEIDADFDRRFD